MITYEKLFIINDNTHFTDFTDLETHTLGASSNLSYEDYYFDVDDASTSLYIRVLSDNQSGHLIIEDFYVIDYTGSGPDNPASFSATASSSSQIVNKIYPPKNNSNFPTFQV